MTSNTKTGILIALCAAVIAAAGALVYVKVQKSSVDNASGDTVNTNIHSEDQSGSTNESTETKAGSGKTTKPLTYDQAIALYGKNYRLQISNCSSNPGKLSIKGGVKFMLDNRDKSAHKFILNKQTYSVAGLGFAVVTAPTKAGSYFMTCDGGSSAEITVYP